MTEASIYTQATELSEGIYAPTIWTSLHSNAELWERVGMAADTLSQRAAIDENDRSLLELLKELPVKKWQALCDAAGMTIYGAVGLSWCEGAALSDVLNAWEEAGYPTEPAPQFKRAARLINPALLPDAKNLKALIEVADNRVSRVAVLISALRSPLEIDISESKLRSASPEMAAFLAGS